MLQGGLCRRARKARPPAPPDHARACGRAGEREQEAADREREVRGWLATDCEREVHVAAWSSKVSKQCPARPVARGWCLGGQASAAAEGPKSLL